MYNVIINGLVAAQSSGNKPNLDLILKTKNSIERCLIQASFRFDAEEPDTNKPLRLHQYTIDLLQQ